jgi:hypothetical protein
LLSLDDLHKFSSQITGDLPQLFEGGFELFDDFLSVNMERKAAGFIEGFVSEPHKKASLVPADEFVIVNVQTPPVKYAGNVVRMKSLIRFRSLLLYRNDLAFGALLDQPVYRFGEKPLNHPD